MATRIDKVDTLIARYEATGRTVFRYKSKKLISVDGRSMGESDAVEKMRGILEAHDPTNPEVYAKIISDDALKIQYQDNLDAFFQERIVAVRNALRGQGWKDGPKITVLHKDGGYGFTMSFTNVGAGANVVGIVYKIIDTDDKNSELWSLPDDLMKSPEKLAALISGTIARAEAGLPDFVRSKELLVEADKAEVAEAESAKQAMYSPYDARDQAAPNVPDADPDGKSITTSVGKKGSQSLRERPRMG